MPLAVCSDVSPSDWIVASDVPWRRLVTIGPAGFPAYARVRFIPDPIRADQRESEGDFDAFPKERDRWRALVRLLAAGGSDPDDCYFALWDGWGLSEAARRWPRFGVPSEDQPPARAFFLFHGSLAQAKVWPEGTPTDVGLWGPPEFAGGGPPAFIWPSDHAWCVAADIDQHWAGVGASVPLIERLIGDPRLDAVEADPTEEQPAYR